MQKLTEFDFDEDDEWTYRAKNIIIHPEFVSKKRDQADIALVEVDRAIMFEEGKVGPICLPEPGYQDEDREAFVLGWGMLFERDKNKNTATCLTSSHGPDNFVECRKRFIYQGSLYSVNKDTKCIKEPPPET